MSAADNVPKAEDCNCFAVRSAARHVSLYTSCRCRSAAHNPFSILAKLKRHGPLTINARRRMVMIATLGAAIYRWNATADRIRPTRLTAAPELRPQ
jgi:hypothetical protein